MSKEIRLEVPGKYAYMNPYSNRRMTTILATAVGIEMYSDEILPEKSMDGIVEEAICIRPMRRRHSRGKAMQRGWPAMLISRRDIPGFIKALKEVNKNYNSYPEVTNVWIRRKYKKRKLIKDEIKLPF